jgi:hypothetical protein
MSLENPNWAIFVAARTGVPLTDDNIVTVPETPRNA